MVVSVILHFSPVGYSNMKLVYMCRARFKNGGLRERPLTENGGGGAFRAAPHGKNRGFWS